MEVSIKLDGRVVSSPDRYRSAAIEYSHYEEGPANIAEKVIKEYKKESTEE